MPFIITDACISCGACESVCPNGGISQSDSAYRIEQDSCTECVGFFSQAQCAMVCPMDCCILSRKVVMTEEALFERARAIHANSDRRPTLTAQTSRYYRAEGGRKWWGRLFRRAEEPKPVSPLPSGIAADGTGGATC